MGFYDILDHVVDLLHQRGRVTYRALKREFNLDDDLLEDLKEELLYAHPEVVDDQDIGLVWTGEARALSDSPANSMQPAQLEATQGGQPQHVEPPPIASHIPEAERRHLTVMFCDLADFTRLSGQLDPEDLRDVIRAYQSTSADVIEHFDGYIAQHLGDGLMVYFGWPQAHEDDAQRSVHAGLGIVEAMTKLNAHLEQEKGVRLTVRIGIHTGVVVIGEIGKGASQEQLALGETPNIASRIEGIAEPDTVTISDTTYQLIQGYFVCENLEPYTLKGVADSLQIYRVVAASGVQSRLDVVAARGLTPLVGRESEMTLLFERWQQVKDTQGQVILLSGEAGIGKSRLVQVFKHHVAGESHIPLECRSSPYYENTVLYPITDLLQRSLRWQQDETPQAKLDKLEQMLRQYDLELQETVPLFATLLSLPIPENDYPPLALSPQRQRQRTFETILAMLLQQADQHPVLFILEDLHWTDPSTLELLDLLFDQTPTAAICVLLTCRPTFQSPWSSRSYLTQTTLNRLSHLQIEDMAERVAGGKRLPPDVLQQIVEKTDGVPLFVEEMTKAVLESGLLQEVNGHYETVSALSPLAIPTTLQDSLMARLDRLVTAKAVAQYAAVIGRQFSYDLLHAVSQLPERTLQDELHRLVEAELLYQRGLPPQATYIFKHALIQDTAYQSLLKRTRQQYHQRIARVLEETFPETAEAQPELLAHHYTAAGQDETAITYWQRAGQRAVERSANTDAISHLTKGLDILRTLPDTPDRMRQELALQIPLGNTFIAAKGWGAPETQRTYTRATELCEQLGELSQLFPVLYGLCLNACLQGRLPTALEIGREFLRLAQSQDHPGPLLVAHRSLGLTLCWLGEFVEARAHFEQSLALFDPQQHHDLTFQYSVHPRVGALTFLAHTLWMLGYPDQALQMSLEVRAVAEQLTHPFSLAYAQVEATRHYQLRREPSVVQEVADTLVTLSTEHGFAQHLAQGMVCRGWALAMQDRVEAGTAQIQQGMDAMPTGLLMNRSINLPLMSETYARMGQFEAGLNLLAEALAAVDQGSRRDYWAELYRLKGELLLTQSLPDAPQAEACFQKALDIARQQQAKSWELRVTTSLAHLWQSQGKSQDAYDLLAPVYGWFTEGFDTADLKDAKALLNKLSEGKA